MSSFNEAEAERYQLQSQGSLTKNTLGPAIASATTIAPTHNMHHVTGTTEITTITPPFTGFLGTITLIPDGAFTFATGGNIAEATTADANQALHITYDGALWYPSY